MSELPSSSCFSFSNGFSRLKRNNMYARDTNHYLSIVDLRSSFGNRFGPCLSKHSTHYHSLWGKSKVNRGKSCPGFSLQCQNTKLRALLPKQGIITKNKCKIRPLSWPRGGTFTGLLFGLLVCYSTYEPVKAEAAPPEDNKSHGKKVYHDYSITGIPGDGRCLFRSVAHGACLRAGKPVPNESCQRELADDLRARVADEFVKRRKETEWFVEGNFDTYVSNIRKPHVWGGEPELFIASHVLRMPITVYMYDKDCGGLISIAEYGEEYGKDNPIRILYYGFGHYDALQIPGNKGTAQSRL